MTIKPLNLPYLQSDAYWLCISIDAAFISAELKSGLEKLGFSKQAAGFVARTGNDWVTLWQAAYTLLQQGSIPETTLATITNSEHPPSADDIAHQHKTIHDVEAIAQNLWLGEALLQNRLFCYLQPIIDKRGKVFGHESFARAHDKDGNLINGGRIIAASQALGIERIVDRHLHVQAIKTFIASDAAGYLFVNFVPGFIHRPEVYLEGLTEAAKAHGLAAKHIVLEFTKSEIPRDAGHLKAVCDYCHKEGYAISLDDIESVETGSRLIAAARPDFVKIDIELIRKIQQPAALAIIGQLIDITHKNSGIAIAEGVETEEAHQALLAAGADLFQGYLFSPPAAITPASHKQKN